MHTTHLFSKQNILKINNHNRFNLLGIIDESLYYMYLKFKGNNLKGVQVMGKINLQCKSSSHIGSDVNTKLKVGELIEYTYVAKALI